MNVTVEEEVLLAGPVQRVWDLCMAPEQMTAFVGFGPIPGIASVRYLVGEGVVEGAVREITNTDGSTHTEDVVVVRPLERIEDRIHGMTSPFRFLVKEGRDTFEFGSEGPSTRLRRTFVFELTSPLFWPLATAAMFFFRRAVRRHHEVLAKLSAAPGEGSPGGA